MDISDSRRSNVLNLKLVLPAITTEICKVFVKLFAFAWKEYDRRSTPGPNPWSGMTEPGDEESRQYHGEH